MIPASASPTARPASPRPRDGCSTTASRWPRRCSRTTARASRWRTPCATRSRCSTDSRPTSGHPTRTIATGQSLGAQIATQLVERNPGRFDGLLTMCSAHDFNATMNAALDMQFALRTLRDLDPNLPLVDITDPKTTQDTLLAAISGALQTPEGQARLALVGSLNNVAGWYSTFGPEPAEPAARIR